MAAYGTLIIVLAIAFGLLSISFIPFIFVLYPIAGLVYSIYRWRWKAFLFHTVAFLLTIAFPILFWVWVLVLFILGIVWLIDFTMFFFSLIQTP